MKGKVAVCDDTVTVNVREPDPAGTVQTIRVPPLLTVGLEQLALPIVTVAVVPKLVPVMVKK